MSTTYVAKQKAVTLFSHPGFLSFTVIVLSQFLSGLASGLTAFGLSVWAFQSTQSVTAVALIAAFSQLPRSASMLFSGALVDRYGQRLSMLAGNAGAALCLAPLLLVLRWWHLDIWHIYVVSAIGAVFMSLQWPAANSAVVALFPKQQYVRANGLLQTAFAASSILFPLTAGFLYARTNLGTLLVTGIVLLAAAMLLLSFVEIPAQSNAEREMKPASSSFLREVLDGWSYLRSERELFWVTLVFTGCSFLTAIASVLLKPLILGFASALTLGVVLSIAGAGMMLGSLAVSMTGTSARTRKGIMSLMALSGFCMIVAGFKASILIVGAAMLFYTLLQPMISSGIQTITQDRTPAELQGRVSATMMAIGSSVMPFAYPFAGPLADHLAEPLLRENGLLAGSVGRLIGTGPGRGTAFLYIVLGCAIIFLSIVGRARHRNGSALQTTNP
jgi:MFS transporter, DHA3 family, macrolide efflux protein